MNNMMDVVVSKNWNFGDELFVNWQEGDGGEYSVTIKDDEYTTFYLKPKHVRCLHRAFREIIAEWEAQRTEEETNEQD